MSAPSKLGWCEHCGEGVTDFCRGKSALCPKGLRVLHRSVDSSDAALTAELDQLRLEVWRQGSRFNCVVLDKPPLPDRGFYRSNAEFLKACGEAVDAFMERSVVQGRARDAAASGARGRECALVCQEHTAGRARGVPACELGACKRTLGTEGLKP